MDKLNNFDQDMGFTCEMPHVNERGNKFLSFLDIGVEWNCETNIFQTSVFRKPTSSKTVMSWKNWGPSSWKNGNISFCVRRAYTIAAIFS